MPRLQRELHLPGMVSAGMVNSAAVNYAAQTLHTSIVGAGVQQAPGPVHTLELSTLLNGAHKPAAGTAYRYY